MRPLKKNKNCLYKKAKYMFYGYKEIKTFLKNKKSRYFDKDILKV